jgi:hypothetical protein
MKKSAKKTTQKTIAKKPAKKLPKKLAMKKPAAKKPAAKKSAVKKPAAKKHAAKKHAAKKHAAKKHAAKDWHPAAEEAVKAVKHAARKMYEEEVKTPFQIAMEMLHFYGRAGEQVLNSQAEALKAAQAKVKKTYGRG